MKEFVRRVVFNQDFRFTFFIALAILFTAAFACESGGDKLPPDAEIQSLAKETTADFANAIDTEDFSKLHAKASSDFQSSYTVTQMKDAFGSIIDKKDLALPSLKNAGSVTASFSPAPSIRNEKGLNILMLTGEFPAKPYPVKIEYEYVWRDSWKLLKLKVNM